jgi:hypothetical protein
MVFRVWLRICDKLAMLQTKMMQYYLTLYKFN